MTDRIDVPVFSRLTDYVGLWAIADAHASSLLALAKSSQLFSHVREQPQPLKSQMEMLPQANGKSIAAIRLSGVLMKSQSSLGGTSTVMARREIRQAASDPEVGAILLVIDSPGGTVAGTQDLLDDVRAARRMKPLWAHAEDLIASAAYWVASGAERITVSNATALVGSIGTLQVIDDVSKAAEAQGVHTLVFRTGPLKGLGTPGDPVTEEQQVHVQGLVNAVQVSFDAAVRKGRSLSAAALSAVRHGGVMIAGDAMDAGLIDAIQPLGKTVAELARQMDGKAAGKGAALLAAEPPMPEDDEEEEDGEEEQAAKTRGTLPTIRRQLQGLPTLRGK